MPGQQAYNSSYYGNASYQPASAPQAPVTSAPTTGQQQHYNYNYNQAAAYQGYPPQSYGYSQADYNNYYSYYYSYYYPNAQQPPPPPPPPTQPPPPPPPPPQEPPPLPPASVTPQHAVPHANSATSIPVPTVTQSVKPGPKKMMMAVKKPSVANNKSNVASNPYATQSTFVAGAPTDNPTTSELSMTDWPPSLIEYVDNAFKNCRTEEQRLWTEDKLRAIIKKKHESGNLDTDWSKIDLPIMPHPRQSAPKKKQKSLKALGSPQHPLTPAELEKLRMRQIRFENNKLNSPSTPSSFSNSSNVDAMDLDSVVVGTATELEKPYFRLTSAPDPSTIRPLPILKKTLELLKAKWKKERKYEEYICSQFKSMRQDLTVQSIKNAFTATVYEIHARIALEVGDLGEYNQCQTQLKDLYKLGIEGNVSEFTAYRILYNLYTQIWAEINSIMKHMTAEIKATPAVAHALQVRSSIATANYHLFFKLYQEAPNMGMYMMDKFIERERINALLILCKAYRPHLSLSFIEEELAFEDKEQLQSFLQVHRLPQTDNALRTKESFPLLSESARKYKKVDIKGQILKNQLGRKATDCGERCMAFIEPYLEWVKKHGGTYQKLDFTKDDQGIGSVYATETVHVNEAFATLPFKLAITEWVARKAFPQLSEFSGRIVTALFIADQTAQGEASYYAPYFNVLPKKILTPLFYDKDDMAYIQHTNLWLATEERRKSIKNDYKRLLGTLSWTQDRLGWEQFLWAYCVLTSRSFPYTLIDPSHTEPSEVLFPLLDALNHKPNTKITWTRSGEPDSGSLSFVAGQEFQAGEQMFNNYGPKGNEELLLGYGFCFEENEHDHIALKPNFSQDPNYQDKRRVLEQCGVLSGNVDPLTYYIHRSNIPAGFLRLMRVLVMNTLELSYYQHCSDGTLLDFVGYRNELAMLAVTSQLLQSRLAAINSVSLDRSKATWWQSYALMYRDGQAKLLVSTLEAIGKMSNTIAAKMARDLHQNSLAPNAPFLSILNKDYLPWNKVSEKSPEVHLYSLVITSGQLLSEYPQVSEVIGTQQFDEEEDEDVIMLLALMRDRFNPDSHWRVFFERVAKSNYQPCPESLAELQDMFVSVVSPLVEEYPDVFDAKIFTMDTLALADHIIANYSINNPLAIVPL